LFGLKATGTILGFMVIFAGVGVALGPFIGGHISDVTGSYYYMRWVYLITSIASIIFASLIKVPEK
jgi:MFS family permease